MCYYNSYKPKGNVLLNGNVLSEKKTVIRSVQSGFQYADWPVVIDPAKGIEMAHWEFIPYWLSDWKQVEESRKKFTTLNAQGEKLLESRMYAEAGRKRRCLVLSTGFYEWRHYKPEGAKKDIAYPYFIRLKEDKPFFMAGIYQPWTDKSTGETFNTFSIVTGPSNTLMTQIHNKKKRQPTILTDPLALQWVSTGLADPEIRALATYHLPGEAMEARTIRKDFREIEDPDGGFDYDELPPVKL